eukprot:CAMPEP_0198110358 /NCGR_PEP_ID=MMETSP1442-20131203/2361_1 /TAXON_ID= /ORGANISM="Craspedostauros australis, Strain CCMP3328" /LENGTH=1062 /DNA_ID=CAMNT_0043766365 /DNA_START=70 /DNA_END=3258 /DNA_ORIENTATION=+
MASFVEANSNFVLKLKIEVENGKPQIRRVKLPRIADGNGDVSYDELCGLAVTFVFPDASCPSNYHVMLTYKDVDQDDVTIASNEELLDAVEQFADKGILRITGEVRPKNPNHINHAKPLSQSTIAQVSSPSAATGPRDSGGSQPVAGTATTGTASAEPVVASNANASAQAPTKPDETDEPASNIAAAVQAAATATATAASRGADQNVQNVLESFVGVLANAVINLEKGLAQPAKAASKDVAHNVTNTAKAVRKSASATATGAAKVATDASNEVVMTAKRVSRDVRKTAKAASNDVAKTAKQVSRSVTSSVDALSAPLTKKQPTKKPAPKPAPKAKEEAEEQKEEARPFIHGRHTCDGCLCTPVVGPRYHAVNVDDYDLCQKCFNNYRGSEITFASVELDRDAKHQQRWWNRHEARQQRLSRARRPSSGSDGRKKNAKPKSDNTKRGHNTPPSAANPATQAKSPTTSPNAHTKKPAPTTEAHRSATAPAESRAFHIRSRPPFTPTQILPTPHGAQMGPYFPWNSTDPAVQAHMMDHMAPHMDAHSHPYGHFNAHANAHEMAHRSNGSADYDRALEEAIRRSLRDAPNNPEAKEDVKKPAAPTSVTTASTAAPTNASVSVSTEIPNVPTDIETGTPYSPPRTDEVQAAEPLPAPEVPKTPVEPEMEPQKVVAQEPEPDIVVESPAAPVTKVAPTATLIVDTTTAVSAPPVVVVETVDDAASEASTTEVAAPDTSAADEKTKVDVDGEVAEDEVAPEVQAEPEPEPSTNEQDVETASSASASIAFIEKSDATTDSNTDQLTNPASSSSEANVSFKEDAVGSGELAEAMGDTFDTVATVINEMLSDTLGSCADNVEPEADDVSLALSDEEPTLYTGATIVDGATSTVRSSEMFGSVGCEWEVVSTNDCNSDVVGGSGEAADASAAARNDVGAAAIMMGSALFNSDMKSSGFLEGDEDSKSSQSEGDEDSQSEGDDSADSDEDGSEFSMPSSVPSEMSSFASCTTSKVTMDQRTAWQSELSKLDEMGFKNEVASVNALERFQAANIGVDIDERPNLNDVATWLVDNP